MFGVWKRQRNAHFHPIEEILPLLEKYITKRLDFNIIVLFFSFEKITGMFLLQIMAYFLNMR